MGRSGRWARTGEFAGDFADGAVKSGQKAAKFVVREVREHPLRTLAIGAASARSSPR